MTLRALADDAAPFWRRQARLTALCYNSGRVLSAFLPAAVGLSAAFACALLLLRRRGAGEQPAWIAFAAALVACAAGVVWWCGRTGWFSLEDARVRLELYLGLHNRLSAAASGIGTWPPAQPARDGLAFRWGRILPLVAGAAAIVIAAAGIPIGRNADDASPATPPESLAQTTQLLNALEHTDLVQPAALEAFRERLEQLRERPAKDWYTQSSLEAGDHLRSEAQQAAENLQRDLATAANSLQTMERLAAQPTAPEATKAAEQLRDALKGLELGNLPLNQELLAQLKNLDTSKLQSLSPEQIAALSKQLKDGLKLAEAMLKEGKAGEKTGDLLALASASVSNSSTGQPGGTGGGTTSAAVEQRERPVDLHTTKVEPDGPAANLDHARPGDVVGVGKGEHTVDLNAYTGPGSAGPAASDGAGGDTVWRDDLTPAEREVLRTFFK